MFLTCVHSGPLLQSLQFVDAVASPYPYRVFAISAIPMGMFVFPVVPMPQDPLNKTTMKPTF